MVLRFAHEAAAGAAGWLFHPSQTLTEEEDGSPTVRFRAGGPREICWRLRAGCYTVTIAAPATLRQEMREMLRVASQGHGFNHESAGELGGKRDD